MRCVHCDSAVFSPLYCDNCNKVLEVTDDVEHDYYLFLGLERSFDISMNHLESQYLMMQVKLHPDRFARKSEAEKKIAAENSAWVNIAYAALKNDFSRAEHILLLSGVDIKDESYMQEDMEFLDFAFELRERSMTHDKDVLSELTIEVKEMRANMLKTFSALYSEQSFHKAAQSLQKVRFLDRFLCEIELV